MASYLDDRIRPASQRGGFADYLDSAAMDKFVSLSYQKMYEHLGDFFGKEIKFRFWDEPRCTRWTGACGPRRSTGTSTPYTAFRR